MHSCLITLNTLSTLCIYLNVLMTLSEKMDVNSRYITTQQFSVGCQQRKERMTCACQPSFCQPCSGQPCSGQPCSRQPCSGQPSPSDNPTLPNLPPPNSTLDTVMAATMQMLNYVWKYKWWVITGVAAGGMVAAVGVGVAAGPVVVGVAGGAVAGIAARKIKDKCTQPPPHEHQD